MSTRHKGVSCDACMKNGFRLRRFKCLICYDYDLCGQCYDNGRESNNHSAKHPMQCLLTKADYNLFYANESQPPENVASVTCPVCGELGFSETDIVDHVTSQHSNSDLTVVICPLCVVQQSASNYQTPHIARHMSTDHRKSNPFQPPEANCAEPSVQRLRQLRSRASTRGTVPSSSNKPVSSHQSVDPFGMSFPASLPPDEDTPEEGEMENGYRANVMPSSQNPIADLLSQLKLVRTKATALSLAAGEAQREREEILEDDLPGPSGDALVARGDESRETERQEEARGFMTSLISEANRPPSPHDSVTSHNQSLFVKEVLLASLMDPHVSDS